MRDEPIRILVVDEHPIVGVGLRALLSGERGFVVDAVVDVAEAGRILATRTPDVLISELGFRGAADGLDLLRRHVGPPVIFFTGLSHPALYRAALDAGAAGLIPKTALPSEIVRAVRTVAEGGIAHAPEAVEAARRALRPPAARESAVVREVARGATNAEVAHCLSIRRSTVEAVLRRLFDRYAVANRTALVGLAQREGWLASPALGAA